MKKSLVLIVLISIFYSINSLGKEFCVHCLAKSCFPYFMANTPEKCEQFCNEQKKGLKMSYCGWWISPNKN